jgi:methylenetetrahydrofolate reductase (NADPH)
MTVVMVRDPVPNALGHAVSVSRTLAVPSQRAEGNLVAKIADILASHGRVISFEFFPPRTDEAMATLERTLGELEPLAPSFVSVTYGAGGTTRERTHEIVVRINRETRMTAMAHLTCAAHTRAELQGIIRRYADAGIENILALGGDPPADLELPEGELHHAIELVRLARALGDFSIGVAVHPEPHPHSPSIESDRRHSADKLAEADFAITQFFFEAHHYFDLVDALHAHGVDKPVIPGIMPVLTIGGIKRMSEMQGSEFPEWLAQKLHAVEDDPDAVRKIGIDEATKLCRALLDGGAPGLHFYTLNRSTATREIHANLGLRGT